MLDEFSNSLEAITSLPLIKTFTISLKDGQPNLEITTCHKHTEANAARIKPYKEKGTYFLEMFKASYPTRSFKKMTIRDIQATLRLYCLPKL